MFRFPLHQIAHVGTWSQYEQVPLAIGRENAEIIVEVFPTYVITVPERHGRTDGETDDILWHNGALRRIARSPAGPVDR